jgi:RHS repeat-associated protein
LFYYTGQERDATTGLQLHGARWYDPATGRWLSEDPSGFDGGDPNLYRYVGNSALNFTDPTGTTQAGNPLANLPSLGSPAPSLTTKPFANLASLASTPSRSVSAPPTVPAAVPSSPYVSTPTLSHEQVAAQLSASNARINDIFVQNGLIAPRHVTKVTPVRIPGGGEEFRKVANSIADSYYSSVTGTNDILSPYYYTDAANQLAGGIVQGFGSVVGALGDTALPGYTNTLIEYSDNKNPRVVPGSPTSGELAGSALVFADPLFAGSSRPAGQLALRNADSAAAIAPVGPIQPQNVNTGSLFNRVRANKYPHNEIYVENAAGGYNRLDSYNPNVDIVSRKFTQLSEVSQATAKSYIREAAKKYAPGSKIANVPSSGSLAGQELSGTLYLEVPIQINPVPKGILDAAARQGVRIRDVNGRVH